MPLLTRNRIDAAEMTPAEAGAVVGRISGICRSAFTRTYPGREMDRVVVISTGPDGIARYATSSDLDDYPNHYPEGPHEDPMNDGADR